MDARTIIRAEIEQGATLAEIEQELSEWRPVLSDEEQSALWLYARQCIPETVRKKREHAGQTAQAAAARAFAHARRVLEPRRVFPGLPRRGRALADRVVGLSRAAWP